MGIITRFQVIKRSKGTCQSLYAIVGHHHYYSSAMTSTWSSAWSSSLSHRHRHHINCHRRLSPRYNTVIDTVIVIVIATVTSHTVTLAIKREHQNIRLKYGHYIAKSISRLLNIYIHMITDLIKKNKKKDGVHDGIWLLIRKFNRRVSRRWKRRKEGGRGIDGVCVCVRVCVRVGVCLHGGKTSHCRSCELTQNMITKKKRDTQRRRIEKYNYCAISF